MKPNMNMSRTFREVVSQYMVNEPRLTHKQTVTRLYRHALKQSQSWVVDRRLWNQEATKIRTQFDANKHLDQESGLTKRLIREAEEKLAHYTHPDKYVLNYMPGGTSFMRNSPPPLEVCFPNGVPAGEEVSPLAAANLDGTPATGPVPKAYVDFANKDYSM